MEILIIAYMATRLLNPKIDTLVTGEKLLWYGAKDKRKYLKLK
jgi:hypothetical protein